MADLAQQGDVQMQIIAVKADLLNKEVQIKQKNNFLKKILLSLDIFFHWDYIFSLIFLGNAKEQLDVW